MKEVAQGHMPRRSNLPATTKSEMSLHSTSTASKSLLLMVAFFITSPLGFGFEAYHKDDGSGNLSIFHPWWPPNIDLYRQF